jgi:hypothetical protein
MIRDLACLPTILLLAWPGAAAAFDSGSTGALGAFEPTVDTIVPLPEDGVLHYTSVTIPDGVTVTFARNRHNTPVYMLASGDVSIAGAIDVSGGAPERVDMTHVTVLGGLGGPGGSDGGSARLAAEQSAVGRGLGPGPGHAELAKLGGGGASPVNAGGIGLFGPPGGVAPSVPELEHTHGGSGGGAMANAQNGVVAGGGGGGGALILGASGNVAVSGRILANGGGGVDQGGVGGGGYVRLVATSISGDGSVEAHGGAFTCGGIHGGCGGAGVIRFDAETVQGLITSQANPAPSFGAPSRPVPWDPSARPTIEIVEISGQIPSAVGSDSRPLLAPELLLPQGQQVAVKLEARNVPEGTIAKVVLSPLGAPPTPIEVEAPPMSCQGAVCTATVQIEIPAGTRLGTVQAWIPSLAVP